jgi:hypothetical protein
MVCVTLYVPPLETVMDVPVEPVLHINEPVAVVDRIEIPLHVFTTVTSGTAGVPGWALIITGVAGDKHPAGVLTFTL